MFFFYYSTNNIFFSPNRLMNLDRIVVGKTNNNMEMTYHTVRTEIEGLLKEDCRHNKEALKDLHRRIEIYNAHKTIANQDDKLMKDTEFLLRSALFLMDLGINC